MLKIKVDAEQIKYTEDLLKDGNIGKRGNGSRKYNNGNKEEQFIGMLGEVVVCDYFNKPRPVNIQNGDNGIDIVLNNQKIDIKTMSRSCDMRDFFVHNLQGEQVSSYYKNNIYLLTSLNKKKMELTICGWVTKDEFFSRASFYPYGTVRKKGNIAFKVRNNMGLYEVQNKLLNKIDSKKDFLKDMLTIKTSHTENMQEVI